MINLSKIIIDTNVCFEYIILTIAAVPLLLMLKFTKVKFIYLKLTEKMTVQLLDLVKKYKFIYDTSCQNYKNVGLKDETWKKIGTELNENGMYIT